MKMLVAVLAAAIGSSAACSDGPTSPSGAPTISSLSPSSGPVGTPVTLTGSGFAAGGNVIKFGTGYIKDVASPDGRTIHVSVPGGLEECPPSNGAAVCPLLARVVMPGTYMVTVINGAATSNELPFTVQQR